MWRKWRESFGRVATAGIILALVAGATAITHSATFQAPNRPPARLAPLAWTACRLESLDEDVLCGEHDVFEDRAAASGKRISIQVAVLPPLRRAAEPDPLFILSGGPGQG